MTFGGGEDIKYTRAIILHISWKNTGQTPARIIRAHHDFSRIENRPEKFTVPDKIPRANIGLVGAGQSRQGGAVFVTDEDADFLIKDGGEIIVYCVTEYQDIFSEEVRVTELEGHCFLERRQQPDGTMVYYPVFAPRGEQNTAT